MSDDPRVPSTLSPAYINRVTELVTALAEQLEREFEIEALMNLVSIASIARAKFRKDL